MKTLPHGSPAPASDHPARRAFLLRSGQLALTGTALPFALNLAAMGEAAAFDATDYKALVCVFLIGGNDHANTVVPFDAAGHARYAAIRGPIALSRNALLPTLLNPLTPLSDGRQLALHPSLGRLGALFHAGKAAVQLNVGPLVVPLTRSQYASADVARFPRPPKLFSHNDQQSVWQSLAPEGATAGWGGRIGDLALASNGKATFTCISTAGNAVFLSGRTALQYQVGPSGAIPIVALKTAPYGLAGVKNAMNTLLQQPRAHLMEDEYNRVTARSIAAESVVTAAIGPTSTLSTVFPPGPLGDQLKVVARMIAARGAFGARRQVFFVGMGGYDTHDNLLATHAGLLDSLGQSLDAFYNATVEMGLARQVTAFTASDFGRTLAHNGGGSDHGWGGHHFVVGGAVRGQDFYGTAPPVSVGNTATADDQWHVGQGRLLPSTSVDQYAATLASWFGVADAELAGLLPNLGNFGAAAGRPDYPRDLGFMA
ncbi:DUF1501 domain-containing protein [Xylophilus sp. Kf1]|nr:DUF1501 domain-containing protein [Xylophilus sp. Kf1]